MKEIKLYYDSFNEVDGVEYYHLLQLLHKQHKIIHSSLDEYENGNVIIYIMLDAK